MKDYVTQIDRAYRITDSRVSLDSVVYAWRDGRSPEGIKESFPIINSRRPLRRESRNRFSSEDQVSGRRRFQHTVVHALQQ